jgi:hypothetical protein
MARFYFMFIAVVGIISGLIFLFYRMQLLLNGAKTVGTVEKKQKRAWSNNNGGGYAYLLVIGYIDMAGEKKYFTEQNAIATYFYNVGDKIKLIQDPQKPSRIMVHSAIVLFSAPIIMLLLAAVAGYVGLK